MIYMEIQTNNITVSDHEHNFQFENSACVDTITLLVTYKCVECGLEIDTTEKI